MWINEVLKYDGGDGYAISRVHPNLRDTVGLSLSTSMTDIVGNTPYKTELEGIKRDGELFFTYYFQKMDTKEISEKLTYAKLYKEYDWIVAMGIHLDDISTYVDLSANKSSSIIRQNIPYFIVAIIVLFILHSIVLLLLERRSSYQRARELENQALHDPLTDCGNRRAGEILLKNHFLRVKQGEPSPLVVLLDLDHFKLVNDTYGHDVGDRYLIQLVNEIRSIICYKEALYRWGGDEFVIICPSIELSKIPTMAEQLLNTARNTSVMIDEHAINLTVSVGISTIHKDDSDERFVLKRSDSALYQSKQKGRDRYTIAL